MSWSSYEPPRLVLERRLHSARRRHAGRARGLDRRAAGVLGDLGAHPVGFEEERVDRVRVPHARGRAAEVRREAVPARRARGRTPCAAPWPCRGSSGGGAARDPPRRGRGARGPSGRTASSFPAMRSSESGRPSFAAVGPRGSRGGSKESIVWTLPATRTSKSAATRPKTGRFFPSTATTSRSSTVTSSAAVTPGRGVGTGVAAGGACARSGPASRRTAPARTLERTSGLIAGRASTLRAARSGLRLRLAGLARAQLGRNLERTRLPQVFLDDEVEEELAHAVLPLGLEDAAARRAA